MLNTAGAFGVAGQVHMKVIRRSRGGLVGFFRDLMHRRIGETERLLRHFDDLHRKLIRPDQFAAEVSYLEDRLGVPSEREEIRPADAPKVLRDYWKVLAARAIGRVSGVATIAGRLHMVRIRAGGLIETLGVVSHHVVTTAGVNFMVDAWQNLVEPELLRFHGLGTGAVAEAVGDTALGTELTTQYNPDNTRATGSLTEGASANVFRTVGTNTVDAAAAVTEHGILSQAATGGGTLWDRSVFSVINLANGDSLQSTYDGTIAAGG